jgi:hypothetical protein
MGTARWYVLERLMTNQEKLAAVRAGQPGSYNFAPASRSLYGRPTFQALAREAHEIAVARGYFHKPSRSEGMDGGYQALLVNVPVSPRDEPAPSKDKDAPDPSAAHP